MRRIRANAIAILTVAWILGTFYYLWQDNKPHTSPSSASQARVAGGRSHGPKVAVGRLEIQREDRTIPLIVSDRLGQAAGEMGDQNSGIADVPKDAGVCVCMCGCVCGCTLVGVCRMLMCGS